MPGKDTKLTVKVKVVELWYIQVLCPVCGGISVNEWLGECEVLTSSTQLGCNICGETIQVSLTITKGGLPMSDMKFNLSVGKLHIQVTLDGRLRLSINQHTKWFKWPFIKLHQWDLIGV